VWQALHDELTPLGVDVTLIALDTPAAASPWLEPIRDDGPLALVDEALRTTELLGWVNVPSAVWFDERGTIVRGPEVSFVKPKRPLDVPEDASSEQREYLGYINAFPHAGEAWLIALRDWAAHGASSPYALAPDEVLRRSRAFGIEAATAAAHYALAEHLRANGDEAGAVEHQRMAHDLDPEQWNRKRQAWALSGGPDAFGTSLIDEMRAHGPESFYPPVDLG
jgi:hypothetical protein